MKIVAFLIPLFVTYFETSLWIEVYVCSDSQHVQCIMAHNLDCICAVHFHTVNVMMYSLIQTLHHAHSAASLVAGDLNDAAHRSKCLAAIA